MNRIMLPMNREFCLVADDLTGALDSSIDFVQRFGPISVVYGSAPSGSIRATQALAIATGTREVSPTAAQNSLRGIMPNLIRAKLGFKKIDSLLRGPWAAEIATCLETGTFDDCVIAPAFPDMGRITRNGAQWAQDAGGAWYIACADIAAQLRQYGVAVDRHSKYTTRQSGVMLYDAIAQEELVHLVHAVSRTGRRVLWCGSGGLANALAGEEARLSRDLPKPILGLFGSDHPVTRQQIAACSAVATTLRGPADTRLVAEKLQTHGVAFVTPEIAPGTSRANAAQDIARLFGALTQSLKQPGTLIVAGGETLQSLWSILQIEALQLTGKVAPGVARSVIIGGPWQGVTIVSKSGAFGVETLWRDVLRDNGLGVEP